MNRWKFINLYFLIVYRNEFSAFTIVRRRGIGIAGGFVGFIILFFILVGGLVGYFIFFFILKSIKMFCPKKNPLKKTYISFFRVCIDYLLGLNHRWYRCLELMLHPILMWSKRKAIQRGYGTYVGCLFLPMHSTTWSNNN